MTIKLYRNLSEPNKIGKNLEEISTATGDLRASTSIINPSLRISGVSATDIATCNYIYIEDFNRYYFVRDIASVRTNLWELTTHIDVLQTYADGIKAQTAVIARQENEWNLYLTDDVFKVTCQPKIITKTFPSGFNALSWVLAVAGG